MINKTEVPVAIIDKIKKLLELTTSDKEHEATQAMETAKRLMLKYSVQFEDLNQEEIKQEIVKKKYENDAFQRQGVYEQLPSIISTITPIFGVYCIVKTLRSKLGQHHEFHLVGFPTNVKIATFALDSILAQGIIEARNEYKKFRTVTFGKSFWGGFAIGLYRKFSKYSNDKEETGITVYDKVKEYLKSIASGEFSFNAESDGIAKNIGIEAGLRAELRQAITSENTGKLLQ